MTTPQIFAAALLASLLSTSAAAAADDDAHCSMVRAAASSGAATLMWPRLALQGIRFPSETNLDIGPTAGTGLQARAALSFSALDFYRGIRLLRSGELECRGHQARVSLQEKIARATDGARLTALAAQSSYLEAQHERWRALSAKAEERLAARVITVVQFDELRRHVDALEETLNRVQGERGVLQARGADPRPPALASLVGEYGERTMAAERELSAIRSLEAWQLQVTGGVIPLRPFDWYGMVELSFSLGAPLRIVNERRYLAARAAELREAPYELAQQWRRLRQELTAARAGAQRELALAERELALIATTRRALESSDAHSVAHARDAITVEELAVESQRVYLRAHIQALTNLLEEDHAS